MQSETKQKTTERPANAGFAEELRAFGQAIPHKALFAVLLLTWVALFHFLGNPTLGYINTRSMFGWLQNSYAQSTDDSLSIFIPFVVLAILWWKREELAAIQKRIWWPPMILFAGAVLLHIVGYTVQQTRLSVVGFFFGLYAITGMLWGWTWLRATFFPFFLFAFMVPVTSDVDGLTLPLRKMATSITVGITHVLGIDVMQRGTQIFDSAGRFQYNVEVECSGLRSLTTMFALGCVFGFITFRRNWKRVLLMASAIPFAIAGNVLRLMVIVLVAENGGQAAGNYVHGHWLFSLVPYVPAMVGMMLVARWLRDDDERPESVMGKAVPA